MNATVFASACSKAVEKALTAATEDTPLASDNLNWEDARVRISVSKNGRGMPMGRHVTAKISVPSHYRGEASF